MDATTAARLITLAVLAGIFVATVLITPRIWSANRVEDRAARRGTPDAGPDKTGGKG